MLRRFLQISPLIKRVNNLYEELMIMRITNRFVEKLRGVLISSSYNFNKITLSNAIFLLVVSNISTNYYGFYAYTPIWKPNRPKSNF